MKKEYIQKLINRYEDGETTLHEEAQLRKYFGRNNLVVPKEWEVYRALFRFEVKERGEQKQKRRLPLWGVWATVAACAALAFMLTLGHSTKPDDYAVINGHMITNKQVVEKEAEDALMMVQTSDEETFDALGTMTE
jgi:UDP-N-acetylmuramyl pentapeptide synthase